MKTEADRRYLVVQAEGVENTYAFRMLTENRMKSILPCTPAAVDGARMLYYDMTGCFTLREYLRRNPGDGAFFRHLLLEMARIMEVLNKYLIPSNRLLTGPDEICTDADGKAFYFAVSIVSDEGYRAGLQRLSEAMIAGLSGADREAAAVCYDFYQLCLSGPPTPAALRAVTERHTEEKKEKREKKEQIHLPFPETEQYGQKDAGASLYTLDEKRYEQEGDGFGKKRRQKEQAESRRKESRKEKKKSRLKTESWRKTENRRKTGNRREVPADTQARSEEESLLEKLFPTVAKIISVRDRAGRKQSGKKPHEKKRSGRETHAGVYQNSRAETGSAGGADEFAWLDNEAVWEEDIESVSVEDIFDELFDDPSARFGIPGLRSDDSGKGSGDPGRGLDDPGRRSDNSGVRFDDSPVQKVPGTVYVSGQKPAGGEKVWTLLPENRSAGVTVRLMQKEMLLGRSPEYADAVIPDETVSRVHAKLIRLEHACEIADCGSMNGTWVNDNRIDSMQPVLLAQGDRIRFGEVRYTLEYI